MGACPCPRCLVKKDEIQNLGMVKDSEKRVKTARKDTAGWRTKVQRARRLLLRGYVVNSQRVDDILGAQSYVPTEVRLV